MAVVKVVRVDYPNAVGFTWPNLLNGDTGEPVDANEFGDRCVQVGGTFGVGGSVNLEGSNNASAYLVLTDPQGNAITKTAAAIEQVLEGAQWNRPNVTAGDGTTSLTVILFCRRSNR